MDSINIPQKNNSKHTGWDKRWILQTYIQILSASGELPNNRRFHVHIVAYVDSRFHEHRHKQPILVVSSRERRKKRRKNQSCKMI